MSTGRRIAVLGVACAAIAAMPLSLLLGAWLGGAIPFQDELAASVAALLAPVLFWVGSARTAAAAVAVIAWHRRDR